MRPRLPEIEDAERGARQLITIFLVSTAERLRVMSDQPENLDLKLVLPNTEYASRDARAALEATDCLVTMIGARFDAMEDRMTAVESSVTAVESRMVGVERRVTAVETGMDSIARSNHRIEQMLADTAATLTTGARWPPQLN